MDNALRHHGVHADVMPTQCAGDVGLTSGSDASPALTCLRSRIRGRQVKPDHVLTPQPGQRIHISNLAGVNQVSWLTQPTIIGPAEQADAIARLDLQTDGPVGLTGCQKRARHGRPADEGLPARQAKAVGWLSQRQTAADHRHR
ncbi:hypothetical protein PTTG_11526 [Puccinia triticina 1-1 BBBD Race 1]|uniref:Uncharacterized protein n=1 Tax=Puccinia triticina (isolate 1-1 / race 1 (BBBD)) TaxID=630390 RepID=A0A0C4FE70_PUCT1|nr:hypothetical protein PTTG_11526 [Puccinia triticina 1-1 BBBD Race 1]